MIDRGPLPRTRNSSGIRFSPNLPNPPRVSSRGGPQTLCYHSHLPFLDRFAALRSQGRRYNSSSYLRECRQDRTPGRGLAPGRPPSYPPLTTHPPPPFVPAAHFTQERYDAPDG